MAANVSSTARRVVITGVGAVTPVGNDMPTTWRNLIAGQSGVGRIERFDPDHWGVRTPVAAEVRDWDPEPLLPDAKALRHMDLNTQYGMVAGLEALSDSGLEINEDNQHRVGIIFGSGGGGMELVTRWQDTLVNRGARRVSPFAMPNLIADAASGHLSIATGATGPNYSPTSACATGANAVADGLLHIKAGRADALLVGGSEAIILPLFHICFERMGVLATPAEPLTASCAPYDLHRNGFVPGEGAAAMMIEDLDHALDRGAPIYAEVIGGGSANDAHDIAQPESHGRGLMVSVQQAMEESEIDPAAVGYVSTHGTATRLGDQVEVTAIKRMFGSHADDLAISSIKPATGHMMGASGALEVIVSAMVLKEGLAPPTLNYETPDPELDIDVIPNEARELNTEAALSFSVGLGGHNAAVLLKRFDE